MIPKSLAAVCAAFLVSLSSSCAGNAASAEEYYAIGMAYFDMGKYDEAQRWLERAASADGTKRASEYNLGRIAYETKKYSIAKKHFANILKRDKENVMALKSIAYTEIMLGDIESAEKYYKKVLELEPENTDDGYNYAMVLYAMKKYEDAENVLKQFAYNMPENKDTLLLLARAEKAQSKVEAIDDYALWLVKNTDPLVRYEYAQTLEAGEFYARAIEELRKALSEFTTETASIKKHTLEFALSRLIFLADGENEDAETMLTAAVGDGFNDVDALRELSDDKRLSKANKDKIDNVIASILQKKKEEEEAEKAKEEEKKKFEEDAAAKEAESSSVEAQEGGGTSAAE